MTPNRPYLLRALYDWITDNQLTPYVLINATLPGCDVPQEHVKEGQIVLNIAFDVVEDLLLGNEDVIFSARFSGVPRRIYVPIEAVVAIYAKENGEGMTFPDEPNRTRQGDGDDGSTTSSPKGKPNLKIVK